MPLSVASMATFARSGHTTDQLRVLLKKAAGASKVGLANKQEFRGHGKRTSRPLAFALEVSN